MMTRIVFLLALGLAPALPAAAQNGSTPGALDLYGTFHAVGARLSYTGDANGNATARLEWRPQGGASWTVGMPMTRITGSRWAASVLWLQPDTPYDVRAVIVDPDGGGSATGATRTRAPVSTSPAGTTIWVATNGNDANAGTAAAPLATLQAAADRVGPGDEIRVRPGLYHQTLDVNRAGSAAGLVHLVADGPGVILDGSDPAYLARGDWRNDGGGVYSVPYAGVTRLVCADSLMRLYHHATLAALQGAAYGVTQGFVVEGGRLYVKLEGGVSPIGRRMHVARYNTGILLDQSYWRVDGFEIRYFGNAPNGGGVTLIAASRCVVSNNHVHTIGGRNIYMRVGAHEHLIENNLCRDPRIGTWPWDATKAHEEEQQGISDRGGRGTVIRYNTVRGTFDGIDTNDYAVDENSCADTDIYENLVTDCGDDPLEPESVAGINLRVWGNRADNSFAGISIAPNSVGPTYVLYNTVTNYRTRGYKTSISHTGQTYVFHNTFASIHPTASVHPTGPFSNTHFRNNVLTGNSRPCVSDDAGESQTGNDFDGDLLWSNDVTLFRWKGVNYANLAAVRSGTGFETNGRSGDPLFVAAALGDYRLRVGSPAIDAAIRLPGVNDAFFGAGPDMGALEFRSGVDLTPPAAVRDLD